MDSLGPILALFGMLLFLVSLISIIYPIKVLGIATRKRALLAFMSSFVVMITAVMITGIMSSERTVQDSNKTASTSTGPDTAAAGTAAQDPDETASTSTGPDTTAAGTVAQDPDETASTSAGPDTTAAGTGTQDPDETASTSAGPDTTAAGTVAQDPDETASTSAGPDTTASAPTPSGMPEDHDIPALLSVHPEDTGNQYFVVEKRETPVGHVRSRIMIDIEAPDAQTDQAEVVTMMAAAVEHHRKRWFDVVAVRLWKSYGDDAVAHKRMLYVPDGCGWSGEDCTGQLWTNQYNAPIPVGLEKWGKPTEDDREINHDLICQQDFQCWGEKHLVRATSICQDLIEDLAQFDYEWTDGFWGQKFDRWRRSYSEGAITYLGDKVKFQNGFGAWIHLRYSCEFYPDTGHAEVDIFQR